MQTKTINVHIVRGTSWNGLANSWAEIEAAYIEAQFIPTREVLLVTIEL